MSAFDATLLAQAVAGAVGVLLEPAAGMSLLAAIVTVGVLLVGLAVERRDLSALARLAPQPTRRSAPLWRLLRTHFVQLLHLFAPRPFARMTEASDAEGQVGYARQGQRGSEPGARDWTRDPSPEPGAGEQIATVTDRRNTLVVGVRGKQGPRRPVFGVVPYAHHVDIASVKVGEISILPVHDATW